MIYRILLGLFALTMFALTMVAIINFFSAPGLGRGALAVAVWAASIASLWQADKQCRGPFGSANSPRLSA